MKEWKSDVIRSILFESGRIALNYFDAPETSHKKDNSLVTVADREIEEYLRSRLEDTESGSILIGEESSPDMTEADIESALAETAWVVDPIDGTAPYANHLPTWGVSVGCMKRGELTRGALFLPRTGELLITDDDGTVRYEQYHRDPDRWSIEEVEVTTPSPVRVPYRSSGMVSLPQEIANRGRFSGRNPMQAVGSAVYSNVQLILGGYIGYVARIKLWDLAGSIPLLRNLGFHIEFEDGRPLDSSITREDWILDAGNPRCWKSTGLLYIARSVDTIEYLRENYRI